MQSNSNKPKINIVWFKRDLRLSDHQPLCHAIEDGSPVLLLAFLEPSLMKAPQSDTRHWRFVYQSIQDMKERLGSRGHDILLLHAEVLPVFKALSDHYEVMRIFSHAETGIRLTYERDKAVKKFCASKSIDWCESPYAGVIRGIKRRSNWPKHWYGTMSTPKVDPELARLKTISIDQEVIKLLPCHPIPPACKEGHKNFQHGGESKAQAYMASFFQERVATYNQHISKPAQSRRSCSRLSPYLAWGNISMRQVYQAAAAAKQNASQKRNINSFSSRLRWHCHFIQKFEMMERYEEENINPGYNDLRTEWDEKKYMAWENGQTGYPLIDAGIRCVKATGYLNFRMRSTLVSFLTHHLWLHWKRGADFLARQFLDFEPGIHYAQFQMQAGTTGYNTIRIYNPVKQSKDHDPEGYFIKEWLPALGQLPVNLLYEPWKMTNLDEQMYGCEIGKDYPAPIVNIADTYRSASKALWSKKGDRLVRSEARKILAKQEEENRAVD